MKFQFHSGKMQSKIIAESEQLLFFIVNIK